MCHLDVPGLLFCIRRWKPAVGSGTGLGPYWVRVFTCRKDGFTLPKLSWSRKHKTCHLTTQEDARAGRVTEFSAPPHA